MNIAKIDFKNIIYKISIIFIICLGIFIRAKWYLTKGILEDDECRLALVLFDKNLWQMLLPVGPFSSTPSFLFVSKIIADLTNYNEYALYAVPFIASVAGIIYFYKLSFEYFKKKISVIIVNLFFAINYELISFSAIFKQYSIEVLVTIMCLYYFPKIDICKLSTKQNIIFAFVLMLMPLISLPSLFLIGAFIIINIFTHIKDKVFYKKLFLDTIPLIVVMVVYYIYNLAPTKTMQYDNFAQLWNSIYSQDILSTFVSYLYFIVYPNSLIICPIILIVLFFVIFCYRNKRSQTDNYIILFFLFFIFAHILHLYPIYGRTALYAFPIFILMFVKTFDSIDKNKIMMSITACIILVGFLYYLTPGYSVYIIKNTKQSFIKHFPKNLLIVIQQNFNSDTDMIVVNEASSSCFLFYNKKLNFNTDNYLGLEHDEHGEITKENDFRQLNNLDSNKNYWFYLIKEFKNDPEIIFVQEWLEQQNIKYIFQEGNSYVYYIKPPYRKVKL